MNFSFNFYSFITVTCLTLINLTLVSCGCGDQQEPDLSLAFVDENGKSLIKPYAQIYGLKAHKNLSLRNDTLYHFTLSLISDTVTYIFKSSHQANDTLTLAYDRNFVYDSDRCGFEVEFRSLKIIEEKTTFDPKKISLNINFSGTAGLFHDAYPSFGMVLIQLP